MTARTPNVFLIGAGPVAGALAGALRHAGVPVLGIWARRADQVRQAAHVAGVAGYSAAPPDLLLESDCVVFAVRDDAIAQVARTVVDTGFLSSRHVLLHCSGALSAAEAFGDVAARVGGTGTLHPLRSIVDARQAAASMRGTVFGIEGDERGRETAQDLVHWLGGVALDLSHEGMASYHAAASMASNFLVALLDASVEAMGAAGVRDRSAALGALLALVRGTVDNLAKAGIPAALTGSIARGDVGTVRRHLAALADKTPALLPIYVALGRRAVGLARDKGDTTPEALEAIERALAEAPGQK